MPKLPLIYAALAAAMIVTSIAQARPRSTIAAERLIAGCIHRSAHGKPWLKQALSALRDQEGGWIGAQVRNRDGSHDLGPMQINSSWVPHFATLLARPPKNVRQWLRYDACFNVEAARWILVGELARGGSFWRAVGAYHSPNHQMQDVYARAVALKARNSRGHRPAPGTAVRASLWCGSASSGDGLRWCRKSGQEAKLFRM